MDREQLWAAGLRENLVKAYAKIGRIIPGGFIVGPVHPQTGVRGGPFAVDVIASGDFTVEARNHLSATLRETCKKMEATCVAFFSEVWLAFPKSLAEVEETERRVEAGGTLEHDDGRREGIFFTFEQRGKDQEVWFAEIVRPENAPPQIKPYARLPPSMTYGERRFLDLMETRAN